MFSIIAQIFNLNVEPKIPLEMLIKEEKADMEIHVVTAITKVRKC